jgi:hypothetical protein
MSSNTVSYALFNISARDAAAPEDLSPDNRANSRFSAYNTDAPLVASADDRSAVLFAAQQALVPALSVDGAPSASFIKDDNDLRARRIEDRKFNLDSLDSTGIDNSVSYFRLGATTPFLAKGAFLTDYESNLLFSTPTFKQKS